MNNLIISPYMGTILKVFQRIVTCTITLNARNHPKRESRVIKWPRTAASSSLLLKGLPLIAKSSGGDT